MDTYSLMRAFADSWMLLAMTLFFVGVVVWAFRPGSGRIHAEAANIPLRDDVAPGCDSDGEPSRCRSVPAPDLPPSGERT